MTHELFGKLKYKEQDESWAGAAGLPRFAAVGQRAEPQPQTEEEAAAEAARLAAELNTMLEQMRAAMSERFGAQAAAAFDAVDAAAADVPDEPDPRDEDRARRRAEKRAKNAALLAKGKFPVRVSAPNESAPTAAQESAFRHLLDNEAAVFDAVRAQVWESYRERAWPNVPGVAPATNIDALNGHFALTRLDISREARAGFAHLVFMVDSDWTDEHGLVIVYSPDTADATWTTWDGLYDLLESDEPQEDGAEYVPTPHDLLLEAVLTGDEAKARELVAAGADINALGPDEYPPLWIAVDQMEPDEVRRLLAFGADPALANPDERTTPLKHAKKLYRDMGFAPSKKRDGALDGMLSMMREAAGPQLNDIKARLDAIIAALEAATMP